MVAFFWAAGFFKGFSPASPAANTRWSAKPSNTPNWSPIDDKGDYWETNSDKSDDWVKQ